MTVYDEDEILRGVYTEYNECAQDDTARLLRLMPIGADKSARSPDTCPSCFTQKVIEPSLIACRPRLQVIEFNWIMTRHNTACRIFLTRVPKQLSQCEQPAK